MGITQEVARWSVDYKYDDVPQKALRISKECILDAVGVAFPGSTRPAGQIITKVVRKIAGEPQASVIGGGFQTSVTDAALANGAMIHAMDYDDAGGHVSGCLVPVLLALGEWRGSTGKELLLAYNVGLEVFLKGSHVPPNLHRRGFHPTPVFGAIGATIAAAKLMGFNTAQTQNALGIVASLAGGVVANFGTMTKPMHSGNAARSGIMAALLTEEGYTGFPDVLEHSSGYAHAFFGDEGYDLKWWTHDLGNPLRITYQGPTIKKYACCSGNHRPLDALLALEKEYGFTYNDVDHVSVDAGFDYPLILRYFEPENEYQAKFSLQYNVAAALVDGRHDISTMDDKKIRSKPMVEAMKKIKVISQAEREGGSAGEGAVRVFLKDGRVLVKNMVLLKGTPDYPLTQEELVDKYSANAKYVLKNEEAKRVRDTILNLENVASIRDMMDTVSLRKKAS